MVVEMITDMGYDAQLLRTQGLFLLIKKQFSLFKSVRIIIKNLQTLDDVAFYFQICLVCQSKNNLDRKLKKLYKA